MFKHILLVKDQLNLVADLSINNGAPEYNEVFLTSIFEECEIIGILNEDELIAYGIVYLTLSKNQSFLEKFRIKAPDNELALMAGCVVHSRYRGLGLQKRLLELREDFAIMSGTRHSFSVVSANTSVSKNNFYNSGYNQISQRVTQKGELLYLFQKELGLLNTLNDKFS